MFCWLTRGPYLLKLIHPWLSGRPRHQAATFFEVTELTIVANSGPCKNNQNHTTHIRISLQGMQVVWIREGTDLMDHQTLLQAHTKVLGFRMQPYEFHSGQMPVRRLKDEHYRRENGKMLCGCWFWSAVGCIEMPNEMSCHSSFSDWYTERREDMYRSLLQFNNTKIQQYFSGC